MARFLKKKPVKRLSKNYLAANNALKFREHFKRTLVGSEEHSAGGAWQKSAKINVNPDIS